MTETLYQIMIRIKDSFIPMLIDKLKLANPQKIDESDSYLKRTKKEQTEKITKTGEQLVYEIIVKEDHIFNIQQKKITKKEQSALIKKHGSDVTINKRRDLYSLEGVEVAIDHVEDIGTFIELQSRDKGEVEKIAKKLGFSSSQYIEHPYDWMKR